jgi:hypothetical protein
MGIRVIRAISWVSTSSDADAVQPRSDVTARPNTAPGMLGLSLDFIVHAVRIVRPVERQTVADEPLADTMQMLVSLTDTSNPAKWSMLRFSF